ncbi:MAG: hypothetical protein AB7R89_13220 [Dehalococcoidia bacterium]
MATQATRHSNTLVASGATRTPVIRQGPAAAVRIVVLTLGAIAVWMAAVLGFQQVAERTFDFTPLDAWVLALAIITYFAAFIGVMVGIISMVRHADEDYLARTERPTPHGIRSDAVAIPSDGS